MSPLLLRDVRTSLHFFWALWIAGKRRLVIEKHRKTQDLVFRQKKAGRISPVRPFVLEGMLFLNHVQLMRIALSLSVPVARAFV